MNPYLSMTFRTFTIWIMAAVLNGLLCGIYMSFLGIEADKITFVLVCGLCSLVFSVPGFFVFWITMLITISRNIGERKLFRAALSVGMILATATAIIAYRLYNSVSLISWFVFPLFIVISATASIMMHFNLFKKIKLKDH